MISCEVDGQMTLGVTATDLDEVSRLRHGSDENRGWSPLLRARFGYHTPSEYYEATVCRLVTPSCRWLDVGCGRALFPVNPALSEILTARCGHLVGIDPDENIEANPYVHERVRGTIDTYQTDRTFDLVTMRMVVEHFTDPEGALKALARLTHAGGKVVVFTVNRWSPIPLIAGLTPMGFHHLVKRILWQVEERDTFPVAYRMNSRRKLKSLFSTHSFKEVAFTRLDDCSTLSQLPGWYHLELRLWRACRAMGLTYPENCLLGIYERQ